MATLYIVSTPIGNLADLSRRAEEVLGSVGVIYAEDTRRTSILTRHLGVSAPLVSLHEHNERSRIERVLQTLDEGTDAALVSDAGTPLVSDPGALLVEAVLGAGHEVVPVPGASAVLAALVGSGLRVGQFAFLGFAPRKGAEREDFLVRIVDSSETTIFFESPERLVRTLEELERRLGADHPVAVARELTKLHETFVRGTLAGALSYYREEKPRGEVTVVVGPSDGEPETSELDGAIIRAVARVVMGEGLKPSAAAKEVARRLGISRNEAYGVIQGLPSEAPTENEDPE